MNSIDYSSISVKEAEALQSRLREEVQLKDDFGQIRTVAGVDVSISRFSSEGKCGIVVLSYPDMQVLEVCTHSGAVTFPYVPGLLAFREIPIFLETYELLQHDPDMLFFDGQGYAHPRRFGLACHGGYCVDKPSIGVAKSLLTGKYKEPGIEAGSISPLRADREERIGDVVRTKTGVKPVFVSPGYRISFDTATEFVLNCVRGYRIPEPTRLAHNSVSAKPAG